MAFVTRTQDAGNNDDKARMTLEDAISTEEGDIGSPLYRYDNITQMVCVRSLSNFVAGLTDEWFYTFLVTSSQYTKLVWQKTDSALPKYPSTELDSSEKKFIEDIIEWCHRGDRIGMSGATNRQNIDEPPSKKVRPNLQDVSSNQKPGTSGFMSQEPLQGPSRDPGSSTKKLPPIKELVPSLRLIGITSEINPQEKSTIVFKLPRCKIFRSSLAQNIWYSEKTFLQ